MNEQSRSNRWAVAAFVVLVAAAVGFAAYNVGVSHGVALTPPVASGALPGVTTPGGAPVVIYPYGWHRPWGFGFGFVFPFFFFALWFLAVRALFWRGSWRRWHDTGPHEIPSRFDEWHRRAHEQMKTGSSASNV